MKDVSAILRDIAGEKIKLKSIAQSIRNLEDGANIEEEIDSFDIENTDQNSEWKARYETQCEQNRMLQQEVETLKQKVEEHKAQYRKSRGGGKMDEFHGAEGKRLLMRMQREKTNLESQMRDYEWRLDQEAKNYHKVDEKRKSLLRDTNRGKVGTKPASHLQPLNRRGSKQNNQTQASTGGSGRSQKPKAKASTGVMRTGQASELNIIPEYAESK